MDVRQSVHSEHAKTLDTTELRKKFLIEQIFTPNQYTMCTATLTALLWVGLCRLTARSPLMTVSVSNLV